MPLFLFRNDLPLLLYYKHPAQSFPATEWCSSSFSAEQVVMCILFAHLYHQTEHERQPPREYSIIVLRSMEHWRDAKCRECSSARDWEEVKNDALARGETCETSVTTHAPGSFSGSVLLAVADNDRAAMVVRSS